MKLNEENDWKDIFRDLPEFDENGLQIRYFVEEVEVTGYVSSVEQNEDGSYTITNLRTGETSVSGMKYWMDEEGTSLRPGYITVVLLQNGEEFARTAIGEENEWSYSFENLAEFDEKGIAYEYTIDEVEVDGYRTEIIGTDIHNIRTGEIDIPVEKIWKDNGVRDIEEITVHLYRRIHEMDREFSEMTMDEMIDHTHVAMAVLSEENDWTFTFENLPEFDEHGMPIEYYLEEVSAEGYESTIIQNEDGSFTVTNTGVGTVEIEGQKSWFDEGEEGRPESITAILTRNGEEIDRRVVTAENEWNYSFGQLPEFDENGIAYTYKVEELPVEGYNTFYAGYDIQNVRTGMVNVNGEKTWDDLSERPESIVINLLQNGVEIDEVTLSKDEDDKWTYSFTELPEFDEDGKAFVYTVTEDPVEGYEATVTGYNILNRQLRAALRIVKVDDFDFPVEGVVFEVEDEEGNLVFRGTTDEDGILETVLPLGTYIVTEISAPEDYIMDPESKTVILDEDGEVFELTVVNILEFEDVDPKPLPPTPAPPKPQPQLPSTGAENGVIWYGLGILMALGGVLLLRKRRNI
ncbi:Cna B-type domain-containing protein [Proteiniclasticum sp.]|uniref:Cna B-type domain-containing protein n=1 Tax=Proteiniclasticum sp. TaxID=2053595 RepID=UPI00289CE319|nr:Cna B-type domain-containing protein [Proteiniclasticum sp.]